jgi:hypothetical protein
LRSVGDQQHRDGREHQDRALDEQGRPVHGDRAHRRDVARAALGEDRRGRGDHAGPDERGDEGAERHQQVDGTAQLPGHEGLDDDADEGGAEDNEHRRELAVLDARGRDRRRRGGRSSSKQGHGCVPFSAAG